MARIARPTFKRHLEYVAIKRIRLRADEYIEPGEDVKLRQHHLRSLYSRRRIGPKGHPWTEHVLKVRGFPALNISPAAVAAVDAEPVPAAFEDGFPITTENGVVITGEDFAAFLLENSDAADLAEMSDDQKQIALGEMVVAVESDLGATDEDYDQDDDGDEEDAGSDDDADDRDDEIKPEKVGSQWGFPGLTDEKFKTKKAARAWLEAQTAPESAEGGE